MLIISKFPNSIAGRTKHPRMWPACLRPPCIRRSPCALGYAIFFKIFSLSLRQQIAIIIFLQPNGGKLAWKKQKIAERVKWTSRVRARPITTATN